MAARNPEDWRTYLEKKLADQQREIKVFEDYYNGDHHLAFATLKFREAFGALFKAFSDNWCKTVVDAPVERLFVEGFRFGRDKPADQNAWDIWQANGLDAESMMAHTEAVKDGRAYILVGPSEDNNGFPRITVEHASQMYVEHAAGDRRTRLAALKKWRDEDGYEYVTLYLPEEIVKWQTEKPVAPMTGEGLARNWVARAEDPGGTNPLGVVPVIPLYNNPTMLAGGCSDLIPAIPLNDAINKELADMLVASEFAAFRQRVIMGVEVPTNADGTPDRAFEQKGSVSRLLMLEDKDAKVAEFAASDLNNYVQAVTVLLQHLAAQTRTPPHYLLGQIVNASGDALKAAETGLVAKVKRKQIDFSDSWEEAMRLAMGIKGGEAASKALGAETIWRDPEYRSEGEQVDAAIKLRALSIPLPALWERIGATPQQVKDWEKKLEAAPPAPKPGAEGEELPPPDGSATEPPVPAVSVTERTSQ